MKRQAERASHRDDSSIIVVDKFIQATRDSGYKGTPSAVSELIDNALQAGATRVHITITDLEDETQYPLGVSILDNGCGMDAYTLRQALRFGGSSRFNDRSGLGRYGMGLPNSSLSQARRVEVYTWQKKGKAIFSFLDVDEIASGQIKQVPHPKSAHLPQDCPQVSSNSGTLVVWARCDRLDHRRVSTLVRKLSLFLGRVFRHYIWNGVEIFVNNALVKPIDPLFLSPDSLTQGGRLFGEPIAYDVETQPVNGKVPEVGTVMVTFAELPVEEWHDLPNDEKRRLGITKGAGVSVVRSGREIDYGWFFMGNKRLENYDDWWRCEIRFEPVLDEAFGITHTKQQIRPKEYLWEILSQDMETAAKALNARVRKAHLQIKARDMFAESERRAAERDPMLRPLPHPQPSPVEKGIVEELIRRHPILKQSVPPSTDLPMQYTIIEGNMQNTYFYDYILQEGRLILLLNPAHPFYKKLYKPLSESDQTAAQALRGQLELILLAAARSEALASEPGDREVLAKYRADWSHTIANFLKD